MKCKQGDLAVCIGSTTTNSPNIGKIVKCIKLVSGRVIPNCAFDEVWLLDSKMKWTTAERPYAPDEFLRPIRDTGGQDETLTWKDVPHKEVA